MPRQRTTCVVIRGELAGVLCSNYLLITDLNIDSLKVAAQTAVVALNWGVPSGFQSLFAKKEIVWIESLIHQRLSLNNDLSNWEGKRLIRCQLPSNYKIFTLKWDTNWRMWCDVHWLSFFSVTSKLKCDLTYLIYLTYRQ